VTTVTSAEAMSVEILTVAVEKDSKKAAVANRPRPVWLVDYFALRARRSESQIHTVLASRRIQRRWAN
jgi:hypothetical protein